MVLDTVNLYHCSAFNDQ